MTRVKKNIETLKNKKKYISFLKSSRIQNKNRFKIISQKCKRALYYSYLHRKKKIKVKLWLQRLHYLNKLNLNYSKFVQILKSFSIKLNKKIISQLNLFDKKTFSILTKIIKLYAYIRTIN